MFRSPGRIVLFMSILCLSFGLAPSVAFSETRPESAPSSESTAPELKGDPLAGKSLFTGAASFRNGHPPCLACHSIAGIGQLGGGALGPDLTAAYDNYGDYGLDNVLGADPLPTMKPILEKHPITPQEQAHLKAFLETTVDQRPVETLGQLAFLAMAGWLVLLILAQIFWRNRLKEVRRPLVQKRRRSKHSAISSQPSATT